LSILRGLSNLPAKASSPRPRANEESALNLAVGKLSDNRSVDLLMASLEALDLINIGLAVFGREGTLLLANQTADHVFELRDGLELTARRTLRTSRKSTPALDDLIKHAAKAASGNTADAILAIPRSSGKRPITLLIRSVEGASAKIQVAMPAALVFILDPEAPVSTPEAELRQLYGLTSMEASLANLLMEGKTLNDCCDELGIRRSTARTHLQHLFEKVGVQRQTELVSVLLKSIGLVRTDRQSQTRKVRLETEGR
jgi:DNA-binding CsgD family transcriptional regulator